MTVRVGFGRRDAKSAGYGVEEVDGVTKKGDVSE